jgi:hypothetical protein
MYGWLKDGKHNMAVMYTARVFGLFRPVAATHGLQVTGRILRAVDQFGLRDIGDNKKGGKFKFAAFFMLKHFWFNCHR